MHKKALVRDLLKEKQTELTAAERKLSAVLLDDQLLTGLQSITRLAELAEIVPTLSTSADALHRAVGPLGDLAGRLPLNRRRPPAAGTPAGTPAGTQA